MNNTIYNILDNTNQTLYYSYINTLFNSKINLQSEYKKKNFKLFLDILKKKKFNKYFLFAGSSIGLIRDGNSIPWVDDYDIIIMEEDFQYFMNEILPELKKSCFSGYYASNNKGLFHIIYNTSLEKTEYFQIDIFVSYFNNQDILYNINHKYDLKEFSGLYSGKMKKDDILPVKKMLFDDIEVNFFNNTENEVKICYGDCINKSIINISHGADKIIFNEHFTKTYEKINTLINIGKQNINKIIENYENNNIIKLTDIKFNSYIDVLKYLKARKCKKIINTNNINLYYFPEIKYFLPKIEIIHLFINDDNFISPELFNYCDTVKFKNNNILNEFKKINYFNSELKFEIINVITFGTFDLLHNGHINIFYECRKYSENLIVGVSSDKLNIIKGKKSVENENIRIANIKKLKHIKSIFLEESLEDKNKYIHNYDADILIMGDDWINKFDWVDCITIYTSRTKNISTTLLKQNNNIKEDIAHGGGSINNHLYSNSLEAVLENNNLFDFIELDVIELKDSFGIAHDNTEKSIYNSEIKFKEMDKFQFEGLTAYNKYSILTFEKLNQIINDNPKLNIIFDTKLDELSKFIEFVKQKINNLNNIHFQVYDINDCLAVKKSGLKNILFALWKKYNNKFSDDNVIKIFNYCLNELKMHGISINLKFEDNFLKSKLNELIEEHNINVFYHKPNNIVNILDTNKYFVDDYLSSLMIKIFTLEPNFDINFYINNNIDLKDAFGDNKLDYYSHYYYNGYREKRQCYKEYKLIKMYDYYISNSFNLDVYKKENPDLVDAFKFDDIRYISHFLAHGFYEKRVYFYN